MHRGEMFPIFKIEQTAGSRWFVAVVTGQGPDSHIGDFEWEADAKDWIDTNAQFWPAGAAL